MAGGAKQQPARSISPSIDFRAEAASGSTALWEQGVGTRVLLGDVKVRRGRLQIAVTVFSSYLFFIFTSKTHHHLPPPPPDGQFRRHNGVGRGAHRRCQIS